MPDNVRGSKAVCAIAMARRESRQAGKRRIHAKTLA